MILNTLINMVFGVVTWLINLLNIPDTPDWVIEAEETLVNYIHDGISLCAYWFGDVWNPLVTIIGLLLIIDYTYPVIIWLIKKLPISSD